MNLSSLSRGILSGLVATVPMTAVMLILYRLLPQWEKYELPPGEITEEVAERIGLELDETAHKAVTALAHFSYGGIVASTYEPVANLFPIPPVAKGVLFGLVVWGVSYLGLLPSLGILRPATEHPVHRNLLMLTAHAVWGSALGLLVEQLRRRGEF